MEHHCTMPEVLYESPRDEVREEFMICSMRSFNGRLTYREAEFRSGGPVALTFEFDDGFWARRAAEALKQAGEHVEGPTSY